MADAASPRYTHGHHGSVLAAHGTRRAADSAAYLLPHLRPGMRVLDVGCGPGTITRDLADAVAGTPKGPSGLVIGVDNAPAAVAAGSAQSSERAEGADGRRVTVRFEVADVTALPYDDGAFDVTHAHQVLQHLTDPVAALTEMGRVTASGGLVAARDCDYGSMRWHPNSPGLDAWLDLYTRLTLANRAHCDAGRRLRAWAREAGLRDVIASASSWCYATPESTRWWAQSWAQRVTDSAFAEQARAQGLATRDELAALAGAWRDWGAHPDAWFAMVHGEILARP